MPGTPRRTGSARSASTRSPPHLVRSVPCRKRWPRRPSRAHPFRMLITVIPLLVCLLGLLAYALSANAKVVELGRLAFACGLLVTLWSLAGHTVRFGELLR